MLPRIYPLLGRLRSTDARHSRGPESSRSPRTGHCSGMTISAAVKSQTTPSFRHLERNVCKSARIRFAFFHSRFLRRSSSLCVLRHAKDSSRWRSLTLGFALYARCHARFSSAVIAPQPHECAARVPGRQQQGQFPEECGSSARHNPSPQQYCASRAPVQVLRSARPPGSRQRAA